MTEGSVKSGKSGVTDIKVRVLKWKGIAVSIATLWSKMTGHCHWISQLEDQWWFYERSLRHWSQIATKNESLESREYKHRTSLCKAWLKERCQERAQEAGNGPFGWAEDFFWPHIYTGEAFWTIVVSFTDTLFLVCWATEFSESFVAFGAWRTWRGQCE
jgi:hypothetical protein